VTLTPSPRAAAPLGLVVAAMGVVYVVWGSTYLGIRIVVEEADPLTSMGVRYVAAGLLLGAVLAVRSGRRRLRVTWRQLVGAGVLGLLLPLLGNGVVAVAESRGLTSGYAALLIAIAPLAIVVFRSIEHDRPSAATTAGVLTGFGGLATLVLVGREGQGIALVPAVLGLVAGTCWAFGSYIQPRLWLPQDAFVIAVYEMLLGGVMLLVAGFGLGEELSLDHSARVWTAWGYLVVFGSVVAFSAYVWLLENVRISLVATYAYVNPVVAVLLGWLVLDERITWTTAVGGLVVVGSVAVVIRSERRPQTPPPVEATVEQRNAESSPSPP
jgi:drug/metabolite transporter (DMT)-like permease